MGEGWYLPSIDELRVLSYDGAEFAAINQSLKSYGAPLQSDTNYWSSTLTGDTIHKDYPTAYTVTMDRKYKKDAFYAYKAWLRSPDEAPFVHLCGKRYVDRVEDVTKVTVYSNLPEVELFVNGESIGKKTAEDQQLCTDAHESFPR